MIDQPVSDSQARKSALSVAAVLLLIAAWNAYRDRPTLYLTLAGAGALLLLAGLFVPAGARAFHIGWMTFAGVLGYINSRIILSIMFYGVMTPTGVISRLVGRNPMNRRGAGQDSYWIRRAKPRQSPEQFERLF